jgi:pyruvate/2-oxoglutarate dehydrogenase complex dihydrolipoamide dehydrogenase (E3) component
MDTSLIVIGAGPAGIEASLTAARCGARVTLVHEGPLGGRSSHGSLLPSKVWLSEARSGVAPADVLARMGAVKGSWVATQTRLLQEAGVRCVQGRARIAGAGRVDVTGQEGTLAADAIILASGSEPTFIPALKPDGKRVIAPRLLARLDWLPRRALVIGGGPTGCETAYLFNQLGVGVTWLPGRPGLLGGFARGAAEGLAAALAARGVQIVADVDATDIERREAEATVIGDTGARWECELVFVATGRGADLADQGLESVGLNLPPTVDGYCCAAPGLYLVGDAAGGPFLANRALAQARIAARHALGLPTPAYRSETIVHAVYTQPEVAQVGRVDGPGIQQAAVPLDTILKAHLQHPEGRFVLAWDADQRITGAWVLGAHAADALAPVATAIAVGASLAQLAEAWPANPTVGEIAPMAARMAIDHG